MPGKQQVAGTLAWELQIAADAIRPLYELPAEIEGALYALGCSTQQLATRTGVRVEDLMRLRREDCAVPYVGPGAVDGK
jgi:hypothetical protein